MVLHHDPDPVTGMKYLIVGLGNPGAAYRDTRHNVGFMVLDHMAEAQSLTFEPTRHGERCLYKTRGRQLILLKPNTFMNLSGKAVRYHLDQEKVPLDRLLILTDDLALPFGTLRLRGKGSDGGHNGLKHIQQVLGTTNYPRLRVGIGDEFHKGQQVDYVLSPFSEEETQDLPGIVVRGQQAVEAFASIGLQRAMNDVNRKSTE